MIVAASGNNRRSFLIGMGASAISGVLTAASMPNFDLSFLGWIALVPLLLAIEALPKASPTTLAIPFGLIWSIAVHNWYPNMFGQVLGCFLIFAVGSWYAMLIGLGIRLQRRMSGAFRLLALPVLWTAFEFVKYIAPVVENWWFVLLAKSQWRFPPALQILSVTGFPGLTFLVMLSNVALVFLLLRAWRDHKLDRSSAAALMIVISVVVWGAVKIPKPPQETFSIAATVDLANQDLEIQKLSHLPAGKEGYYTDTPEMSQAIFDVNAELTRKVVDTKGAFVVWPENEFADADDPRFIGQLGALAKELGAYIVADVVWRAPTGMHDTALMVGPEGKEMGRRAKINTTDGEERNGFVPGPRDFPVFDTPHGKVGIGVCWDRHRLWITRELARAGAKIVLMPVDDDFNHSRWFPAFHASDSVFRAVENRVAFGLGSTSGVSLVVDPYGRVMAESGINEREAIIGKTFTVSGRTLYTRVGDWFGWLMVVGVVAMVGTVVFGKLRDTN
ncbi:MAG: apolipoprotein N-acyltransferase [Desulfobacterales bacterium]|uniref:Apolipoprotein N-acyltransferase n=1 Tax=Candidatus Desulfatibia vada TaxID=2841696 RepID=A0A8J6TLP5_9BACT|nr:apolipoprotein N-acyltransferase [Candidatus Desulfatibia vada]MBL6971321.1 apolipoprotein N-acyltransferase [Desulfobacterales bacterium]MBL7217552.1 apolipoprotein N-acyltransferase [Desulfobacteraceae bacterium]